VAHDKIRVGIVGANPDRGWAARGHVPALRALDRFELVAVGTSRPETAERAARQFGAAHAFTDARALALHPDVDLVTITVKVPAHAELVQAALDAGKDVYCEWPLARTTAEAEVLATAARRAGVRTVVGLQARYALAIERARELIAEGYVGRITSVVVYAVRGKGATDVVPGWSAYTYEGEAGGGLLEVYGGHVLDAIEHMLGGVAELSASLSIQRPRHTVAESGATIDVTSPDHLLLNATLAEGAVLSAHVHDGKVGGSRVRVEIAGTEGDLAVFAGGGDDPLGGQLQISDLRLLGARGAGKWEELPRPGADAGIPAEAANVARLYAAFAAGREVPDFDAGVRLHRLLDAIRLSDARGATTKPPSLTRVTN
jgi:predicted dehydrogenase